MNFQKKKKKKKLTKNIFQSINIKYTKVYF